MDRREFLKYSTAAAAIASLPWREAQAAIQGWRSYETTTVVQIVKPAGISRAWIPLPSVDESAWHQSLGNSWKGNATRAQVMNDGKYGISMLYAEWAPEVEKPIIEVTSRVSTRDRAVDVSGA